MNTAETPYDKTTLPEPHEGVAGTDRAGDPLLVSGETKAIIARLTRHLWSANLGRPPHTLYYEQYERMTAPRPGDPVVVLDTVTMTRHPDYRRYQDHGVGYLVLTRTEWWTTHEVWEQEKAEDPSLTDDDRMIEREVWYVQYGPDPADVCRWVNCQVVAIPNTATPGQFTKAAVGHVAKGMGGG